MADISDAETRIGELEAEVERLREHVTLLEAHVGSAVAVDLSRQHAKDRDRRRCGKHVDRRTNQRRMSDDRT